MFGVGSDSAVILVIRFCMAPSHQPQQSGAKRLLNGNDGVLNTLFWWRKYCN